MAYLDYYCCDICGSKAYYDSDVDYEWNVGEMAVLCKKCSETHSIGIFTKDNLNDSIETTQNATQAPQS